ncbi:MAG TPA: DUF1572 family protein [Candidatus Acidoferrales bacterium]|nr:DUF1572 family protein [Candidatus Acidoferrales bacterium]
MKPKSIPIAKMFLGDSRRLLAGEHLPHIVKCLQQLTEEEIWWRPNTASNSAGNLVLHLCGNVRQWIISNLGENPDVRDRDSEFAERGPIPRTALIGRLKKTVREACEVLGRFPEEKLSRKYVIQGLHVTGLQAVAHVVEHFAYHTGQIVFITKLKRGKDLRFTRLPLVKKEGVR